MSFFRFAGNIAEGARQSDEKARGRRARAIEAYDAFVRNNPEATKADLQGRVNALSDGENYLFNALPDDESISTQVARNENRKKIRENKEAMIGLQQDQQKKEMIDARASEVMRREVAKNFGNPNAKPFSEEDRRRLRGEIEGSLPAPLKEAFYREFGDGFDFTAARQKAQMDLMAEAKPYVDMLSKLDPDSIERANIPAHLKPFVMDIAKRRQQKIDDDRFYTAADNARKDAASALAKTRHEANQEKIKLEQEIAQDKERKRDELVSRKAALQAATTQQEALISSTQANLSAAISASDLSDAEKEHATNNLAHLAATYHIPSTMYEALAKMAIEDEDGLMPMELYNLFTAKHGLLRTRSAIIQDAAAGITRAPQRMVATLNDAGGIIGDEPGSFTAGVIDKINIMKQRMSDLMATASDLNAVTLANRQTLVKRHTEQIQSHIDSASPSSTSDYDADVIQALSAQVGELREIYDANIRTLKPAAEPQAEPSAPKPAPNQAQARVADPVTLGNRRGQSPKINQAAADEVIRRAMTMVGNPMGTSGYAKRNRVGLRLALSRAARLDPVMDALKLDVLEAYAKQQLQNADTQD